MFQITYTVVKGNKQFAIDKNQAASSNKSINYVQQRKQEKPSKNGKQYQDA